MESNAPHATPYRGSPLKVLILKPSSLGDIVQSLPVLRLLRRDRPDAQVYWWVESGSAPLLEQDPDLAGIVRFERRRWVSPIHWPDLWRCVRDTRRHRFDWVIDLQGLARTGILAWLANGATTIGVEDPREGAACFYDYRVPRPSEQTHAVDWYLEVLRQLGIPVHDRFDWMPAQPVVVAGMAAKWPLSSRRWITLLPGARWLNKRWPVNHFCRTVKELCRQHADLGFVVIGGGSDRELGAAIAAAAPDPDCVLDLTGNTTLPEMVEWIRLSAVTVSNDTGPMHVAAALKRPVVAMFGPTNPRRTGPYGQLEHALRVDLPCAPCMKDRCHWPVAMECMDGIDVERVCAAIRGVLEGGGS